MSISLIVLPGSGQRDVICAVGTTLSQFVQTQNLHGRNIILNGVTVPESGFSRALSPGDEVAATLSVKGA